MSMRFEIGGRQVALFFKWIKQHLRIKVFYANSENAVKTKIWIAVSVYVLVVIIRKLLNLKASLYQILNLTMFERPQTNLLLTKIPTEPDTVFDISFLNSLKKRWDTSDAGTNYDDVGLCAKYRRI